MRIIGAVARWLGAALLWTIVALLLAVTIVPRFLDRTYYDGPVSGHFDGAHFANLDEGEGESPIDPTKQTRRGGSRGPGGFMLRWIAGADERPPWPERVAVAQAKPADLPPLNPGEMRATWVGHATVLIETPGLNILTDPIWSDVAGRWGIGPERVAQPGIAFDDLPRIDLIVVSHAHYDHMDLATLKRLWERDRPTIVTSLGNDAILRSAGIGIADHPESHRLHALDWGKAVDFSSYCIETKRAMSDRDWQQAFSVLAVAGCLQPSPARVTITRNHHWSSRWGADRNRALWSSFVIDTPSGSVFFAGDTGPGDMEWPAEARRTAAGPIHLAIIPIGAFRFAPGQMWSGSHIGPKQAVEVFQRLGARSGLPIHWGTFRLSWEAYDTPPKMLALEAQCAGLPTGWFAARKIGAPFMVPPVAARPAKPPMPPRCDRAAIDALR